MRNTEFLQSLGIPKISSDFQNLIGACVQTTGLVVGDDIPYVADGQFGGSFAPHCHDVEYYLRYHPGAFSGVLISNMRVGSLECFLPEQPNQLTATVAGWICTTSFRNRLGHALVLAKRESTYMAFILTPAVCSYSDYGTNEDIEFQLDMIDRFSPYILSLLTSNDFERIPHMFFLGRQLLLDEADLRHLIVKQEEAGSPFVSYEELSRLSPRNEAQRIIHDTL